MGVRKYDLAFSLGGNCSAAHNLLERGLRPFSLPFDWLYVVDERPISYLSEGLSNRFSDLCRKENLRQLLPGSPEYAESHSDRVQYADDRTGYRFVNHFVRTIDSPGEYERVHDMLVRRIDRMYDALHAGNRFLMLLATPVDVSEETLRELLGAFRSTFPDKVFELDYLHFGQDAESVSARDGLTVRNVRREQNDYDFLRTNWEWRFLDDIEIQAHAEMHPQERRHRKLSFRIWPHVDCVVRLVREGEGD